MTFISFRSIRVMLMRQQATRREMGRREGLISRCSAVCILYCIIHMTFVLCTSTAFPAISSPSCIPIPQICLPQIPCFHINPSPAASSRRIHRITPKLPLSVIQLHLPIQIFLSLFRRFLSLHLRRCWSHPGSWRRLIETVRSHSGIV